MAQENIFGIEPYAFEPEYTEEELENLATENNPSSPIIPTLEEWCSCGQCEVMPTVEECMCCKQCDYTVGNMGDLGCITDHDQFDLLILNPDVLSIAFIQFMMFKKQQGRAPEHLSNKQSRLVAYRQFVCWMFRGEKLGKGKRVTIPSCVVKKIREHFPEQNGQYIGFKTAFESMQDLCNS